MARKIAISNLKGGVLKTTTAFNLGINLSVQKNKKVLLIDADQQGDLTSACGINPQAQKITITELLYHMANRLELSEEEIKSSLIHTRFENIDLIPCNASASSFDDRINGVFRAEDLMRNLINSQGWDEIYDYIVIDSPPSLAKMVSNIYVAADEVIIPLLDIEGVSNVGMTINAIKAARIANPDLKLNGVLFVKQKLRTNLHKQIEDEVKKVSKTSEGKALSGAYIYKAKIRDSIRGEEAMGARMPLIEIYPKEDVTKDYIDFTNEFYEREVR